MLFTGLSQSYAGVAFLRNIQASPTTVHFCAYRSLMCFALVVALFPGGLMFDLHPNLPDDTLIQMVRLPTRIRNAMAYAGIRTIGELRETTDESLVSIPNLGPGSIEWLRKRVGRARRSETLMTVFDRAEAVRCPQCALAGIASFTDEDACSGQVRLPEGFKVVVADNGKQIYCVACNHPAITLPIDA